LFDGIRTVTGLVDRRALPRLAAVRGEQSPPTQAALGLHLGIDRTVLTYVIDDLVREGLVERQTDEADRRVRRLSLTTQGRECLARLDEVVAASEAGLFAALPEGERAELARLIPRAAASIHAGDEHACTIVQQIVGDSPEARKTPA
jgi:DNA-binding MarR family transcriptional regulator